MVRPTTISNDEIFAAVHALYVEKGPRATSAEIAARAGVSEGILFKRFGSKAALLKAALSTSTVGTWIEREARAQGPLRTQQDFERVIRLALDVHRHVVPMVVMAWASRSHREQLPIDGANGTQPPLVAIRTLTSMLQAEMDAGHLARRSAQAIARILLGSTWYFVFLGLLLEEKRGGMEEDTFVEELARVVFGDLDPARGGGTPARASTRPRVARRKRKIHR